MKHLVSLAVCGIALSLLMGCCSSIAVAENLLAIQPVERFSVENFVMQPKNIERVSHVDPIDRIFKASQWYLRGATAVDMTTTIVGIEHHGVETGLMRFAGSRNTSAIVAGNVAMNFGVEYVARKLYQKGGKWRYAGAGLNVLKGTGNLAAGISNASYITAH